jgi:aldehyde:ferredoxin oxidoreductase
MGSKGVKAIVINAKNTKAIEPMNKEQFKETVRDFLEILKQDKGAQSLSQLGTPRVISFLSQLGSMPSWNYHAPKSIKAEGEGCMAACPVVLFNAL